jgi:hypothetical protein
MNATAKLAVTESPTKTSCTKDDDSFISKVVPVFYFYITVYSLRNELWYARWWSTRIQVRLQAVMSTLLMQFLSTWQRISVNVACHWQITYIFIQKEKRYILPRSASSRNRRVDGSSCFDHFVLENKNFSTVTSGTIERVLDCQWKWEIWKDY